MKIALNKPLEPNLEKLTTYLGKVNQRGWYTNFGPVHEELTRRLESYLGVKNLLLVSNGTLAIQVACKVLNVKAAITTPFSFVATTSALLWQGIEVAFSDIDANSFNLCPKSLEQSIKKDNKFDSIIATHVYGNPCDVLAIEQIAKLNNKKVIYDAAHAFDVKIKNDSVLKFGDASTLSFHATKLFHTVEGGAIVFKKRADYEEAKKLINFGISDTGSLGNPGINAKLNEYQCAVGLVLLDDIEMIVSKRTQLFNLYRNELKDVVKLVEWHSNASINGAYICIYIEEERVLETVINHLEKHEIQCRRYFTPSLDTAYPETKSFGCPNSHKIANSVLCLPLHYYLSEDEVLRVTSEIKTVLGH